MNNDYGKMMEELKNMPLSQRSDYLYELRSELAEQEALNYVKSGILDLFVLGAIGRVPDQDNLAFTNAGVVLNTIYRIYKKYPELKVDDLLEQALIKLLKGEVGEFYAALNTIDTQLYNEKSGASPFRIDDPQVFISLKDSIRKNSDYLKNSMDYRGRLYENKLYGFVEDIDKKLEEQKGVRVL